MRVWRIGTRGSRLALWQAEQVRQWIEAQGHAAEIVIIKTSGDRLRTVPAALTGRKGLFIKELEEALLDGRVDLAVHSMKDVPTEVPDGLGFPALLRREDPRDCLIGRTAPTLQELPPGARVGTSSVRRQAQLRHLRPDLRLEALRGNVDTRLARLDRGDFDAIVVARAGIERLGLGHRITQTLEPEFVLPAVGQGVIGVETRTDNAALNRLLASLDDAETRCVLEAERALLSELHGGCQVPVGALARREGYWLWLIAAVASPDGRTLVRLSERGPAHAARAVGQTLARRLLEAGADRLLAMARSPASPGSS
jgi:hydroxymethylbilane synthase